MKYSLNGLALSIALILSGGAHAGVITNESSILTNDDVDQLSEWLGTDVDLTRVFSSTEWDGQDSTDWHEAVDGLGATFTVMTATAIVYDSYGNESYPTVIIGGYNSYSWSTDTVEYFESDSLDNFIFNLSSGLVYEKNTTNALQISDSKYGVGWGLNDLVVDTDLYSVRTNFYDGSFVNEDDVHGLLGAEGWSPIYSLETFTISDAYASVAASDPSIDDTIGGDVIIIDNGTTDETPESETGWASGTTSGGGGGGAIVDITATSQGDATDVPAPFAFAGLALLGLFGSRRKV